MAEELLTVRQVIDRTKLSERTIRALIADGRLPVVRPDGVRVVRVPGRAVDALMEPRGRKAGTTEASLDT